MNSIIKSIWSCAGTDQKTIFLVFLTCAICALVLFGYLTLRILEIISI